MSTEGTSWNPPAGSTRLATDTKDLATHIAALERPATVVVDPIAATYARTRKITPCQEPWIPHGDTCVRKYEAPQLP